MRVTALDAAVKPKRSKLTKEQTDFLPHWNVEPWSAPVDGAALLEELRKHFTCYIVLPKHADVVLALWTLHTWVFDCFDITPYLAITSPAKRCSKTLLMTMLYWLCCRAKKNDSMSKAAIYRSVEAERSTLILDEVGWVVDLKDERQGVLCGGFERLGYVEICEGEGADITTKRYTTKRYSTYCPKAFGLIGKLTATLMDRSIGIAMQRKLNEKVERLRRHDNDQHRGLRQQCLRWANDNRAALPAITVNAPDGLNDRAFDAWEPLLVIAERVGGEWPKLAVEAAISLSGQNVTEEKSVELLADIELVFAGDGVRRGRDNDQGFGRRALCRRGKAVGDLQSGPAHYGPTGRQAAWAIPDHIRGCLPTGTEARKGYKKVRFLDFFERYRTSPNHASPQDGGSQACKRVNADEMGTTSDFSIRVESDLHGCEKCEKSANDGALHAYTDKNPQDGSEEYSGDNNGGNGAAQFRSNIEAAYEELAARETIPVDPDDLRYLTISAKSYLEVIADELRMRGVDPPESGGSSATLDSSQ